MASLLFITTLSVSANPRLYKEILCARDAGHDIHVLCFRLGNWTDVQDDEKIQALPGVRFTRLSATRKPFMPWLIASLLERVARRLTGFWKHPMLDHALRGLRLTPDWVIAHNPAAFLPATRFARRTSARLGIDVEDYHPGETQDPRLAASMRRLMRHTLSAADYVSFAAPLIQREVATDLREEGPQWMTLLNWFPSSEFPAPESVASGPLKLVWFSQVVSARRGLELVLPAIIAAGDRIELHIFGHPDPSFTKEYLGGVSNIFLHGPVRQTELHSRLVSFDVGLAIDVVADRNRELAITNKILAYLQAGLFLAVTETQAQRAFMADHPDHGILFHPDASEWERLLDRMLGLKERLRATAAERQHRMRSYGWEQVSRTLALQWRGEEQ
jgi:hypothetical protein